MTDYGLVSIITPNYNCGKFIAETIESVQAQTYQNWELLIQDDCSTDDSYQIALEYAKRDPRIKVERNAKNSGAAVTRNNALKRAEGRWIAFLDSDDLWSPEKLEKQIQFMVNGKYYFSYTGRETIDEYGNRLFQKSTGPKHITKFGMYCYCWVGCLSVMYDAKQIGLVQIKNIKKNNDYAIWLKVIKKADCYLLSETLAYYRVRKGSISNTSYLKLIKWHYKLFREADDKGVFLSIFLTMMNLFFGVAKKILYINKVKNYV